MRQFTPQELPKDYTFDERTGFLRILTSQKATDLSCYSAHLERSLAGIRTYLHSVLENKFCPFVTGIEAQDGYYVYPVFHEVFAEDLGVMTQEAREAFLILAGESMDRPDETKFLTTMISFHHPKNQSEEFCKIMDDYRDRDRMSFLQSGLMISQMHPFHSRESAIQKKEGGYSSGVPLLMVRAMHRRDHVFMRTDEEMAVYESIFGKRG